ncbi:MAG TPA: efflux RND transporter periplasmic adaptor subunit, partial [Vicinamibacteria bacterium]|nr:efflux RND transporter periplasmic adaptor subunit [Vicinamibacteria bacterium]
AEAQAKLDQKEVDLTMKALDLEQRLAQAEADLGKARLRADVPADLQAGVELQKARLDFAAREAAHSRLRAERDSTLSAARAQLRSLANQRDRAQGRVQELEAAIARMTVRAPQDGIVIHKSDWRDEKKKVGDDVWRGDTVLSLPDLSEMRADGTVDEADGGQVRPGQKVVLRLPARPDLDLAGEVRTVGQTVRRKSWRVPAKVYKVEIALAATDPAVMRPAMRFLGEIEVARLASRLLLPPDAIVLRDHGPVVFAKRGLGFQEVSVRLGRRNRRQVEVLEGLSDGDLVRPQALPSPESRDAGPNGGGSS